MSAAPISPNFNARDGVPVDMLVLHYTGMKSAEEALVRMCDPACEVSAHYMIDEDGTLTHLVDEQMRAWHAGVAMWRGDSNINSRSIGIELVNPGHEFGYRDFPDTQMQTLITLCQGILARHEIPTRNVVAHSDVAPSRKQDPGERFDWARLAAHGIGLWPAADLASAPVPLDDAMLYLSEIGYDCSDPIAAVVAFQRHFCPTRVDGKLDVETRRAIARVHTLI